MLGRVARALFDDETPETDARELRQHVVGILRDFIDKARGAGFDLPIDDPQVLLACNWLVALTETADG